MLPDLKIWDCQGSKFILFEKNDLISNSLKATGAFGDDLVKIACLICDQVENPLVLDIGANLGSFTVPLGQHLAKINGEIHAFEPQRIPFYQLCSNVILNRLDNAFLYNCAVGESDSTVEIHESMPGMWNSGAYSLHKEYRQAEGIDTFCAERICIVDLRSLNSMTFPRQVHLIKLDVEGYELEVVRGAKNFLVSNGYPHIIFEAWDSAWYSDKKSQLFSELGSLGYEVRQIDRTNFLAQHTSAIEMAAK